jgi:16S rRNA (cytosine967-C5)-methyltransferase
VLRIALVQALVLGTPQHAAIATALPLVDGGPRKLVHGVFGTLMRNEVTLPDPPTLPADIKECWREHWGDAMTADAARAIAAPPPVDFTLKDDRWAEELRGTSLLPGHVRLAHPGSVVELPGYEEGGWWVQDIAASLPARLIGAGTGSAIDACAAPGGKTMQLAAAGWQVTAVDVSESRLARLSENLARTKLDANVVEADALFWSPDAPADAVLLDAPCSATGIFRRHPDVLYRASPAIIAEMAELQTALLGRAASWVKPGGTLIYATCSLEPEEGEAQIEAFLAREPGFAIDPIRAEELPAGVTAHQKGWLRLLPGVLADQGGCDGFFMVRMRRTG